MFCALLGKISGERLQDHWSSFSISHSKVMNMEIFVKDFSGTT